MLIKFKELCNKYNFVPNGIVHIGAHELEEMSDYNEFGISKVIWIEGNPSLIESGSKKIEGTEQLLFHGLIYDEDNVELDFNITNNMQSSSILKFGKHKEYHPTVDVVEVMKLKSTRVDTLLKENNIEMTEFDFVNLDIQGVELKALKSFGSYLNNVKYIYTEVNSGQVYENNDLISDLDLFLSEKGFIRVETYMTPFEWGDAFYIRKNENRN
jgi:FkbM family methyltransferase